MTSVPSEELLTVQEAAATLRISTATAYRLVKAGQLPATRVGRQLRIYREDLARNPKPRKAA